MEIDKGSRADQFRQQSLKNALKRQLRAKKFKYQDLAEHLDCSVPTVKRILGEEELSLSRLLEILRFLDLSLTDLEMLSAQDDPKEIHFTPEQDRFLAQNPHYFAYLSKLFGGDTPQQIAEKFKLTALSTQRYLLALEKMELIRVTGKQRVKPSFPKLPRLGRGDLAKAYYAAFIQAAAEFFIKTVGESLFACKKDEDEERNARGFTVHAGRMKPEAFRQFVDQQKKLLEDLGNLSRYQDKVYEKSELESYVVMQGHTLVEHDHPGLTRLTDVFGQVTNI